MQTRSSKKITTYEVFIDFDEASTAWRENKIVGENGCYKYKCLQICKNSKECSLGCVLFEKYCKRHLKMNYKLFHLANTHS